LPEVEDQRSYRCASAEFVHNRRTYEVGPIVVKKAEGSYTTVQSKMKRISVLFGFLIALFLAACVSTEYYTYSGSPVYSGTGGAAKNINGVDLWVIGTPPRKFMIIGYIMDSRPNRGIPLITMQADMASQARKAGGDGLLLNTEQVNYVGTVSSGNVSMFANGNMLTGYGSGMSFPLTNRESRYYVIKYVQ